MRKDFAKLLVQSPRANPSGLRYKLARRVGKQIEEDEVGKIQGMRRPYNRNYSRKEFGEYFAPMLGMLKKNVGRPWNKVYSELCEVLTGGGTVIQHAKVHLFQYVEVSPQWVDGKPCNFKYGGEFPSLRPGSYYVDQRGLLRVVKQPKKSGPRLKEEVTFVELSKTEAYVKHEGIWYRATLAVLGSPELGVELKDVFLGNFSVKTYSTRYSWLPPSKEWRFENGLSNERADFALNKKYPPSRKGPIRFATSKRSVSNREIKRAGLR